MTIKLTALLTSACVVCLYALSLIIPNDPYFFVISSNFAVALARLVLAAAMIYLAIKPRFRYKNSNVALSLAAASLVIFGVAGLAVPSMDYALWGALKPFDYLYFVGSGAYFGYYSMVIAPGRHKLTLSLPKLQVQMPLRIPQRWSRV